ncbi:hypothetical protein, no similarity [Maudiozyma barnettii]|uniref:Uncharacterized protein n=1 Tax=Maudiozyma barnettii TaxID=61262 RepID=A0A8H2VKZ1_9SACH|nr:hypothetical protein, no similarity [Kazachstania barnettii]CAB4257263.1 hypothetical protein, no similarity [Kazachstania barnettii]CAD1784528.1 hypothetical protein, no similarity [Kazachstania barnettii]
MYIFDNSDMYCCDDFEIVGSFPRSTQVINIPTDPGHTVISKTIHLVGGFPYMLYFQIIKFSGHAIFMPTITLPSGENVSDFTGYVYVNYEEYYCDMGNATFSIISEGTDSYTITYSTFCSTKFSTEPAVGKPYLVVAKVCYILNPTVVSSTLSSATLSSSNVELSSSSIPLESLVVVPLSSSSLVMSSSSSDLSPTPISTTRSNSEQSSFTIPSTFHYTPPVYIGRQ